MKNKHGEMLGLLFQVRSLESQGWEIKQRSVLFLVKQINGTRGEESWDVLLWSWSSYGDRWDAIKKAVSKYS